MSAPLTDVTALADEIEKALPIAGPINSLEGLARLAVKALRFQAARIAELEPWKQNQQINWPMEIERRNKELAAAESALAKALERIDELVDVVNTGQRVATRINGKFVIDRDKVKAFLGLATLEKPDAC